MNRRLVFSSYLNCFSAFSCVSCQFSPPGEHSNFNLFPHHTMLELVHVSKKNLCSPSPGAVPQDRPGGGFSTTVRDTRLALHSFLKTVFETF